MRDAQLWAACQVCKGTGEVATEAGAAFSSEYCASCDGMGQVKHPPLFFPPWPVAQIFAAMRASLMASAFAALRIPAMLLSDVPQCRRCSECEGQEHHWIESYCEESNTYYACKHCPVVGDPCLECEGGLDPDGSACPACGGVGVVNICRDEGRTLE